MTRYDMSNDSVMRYDMINDSVKELHTMVIKSVGVLPVCTMLHRDRCSGSPVVVQLVVEYLSPTVFRFLGLSRGRAFLCSPVTVFKWFCFT